MVQTRDVTWIHSDSVEVTRPLFLVKDSKLTMGRIKTAKAKVANARAAAKDINGSTPTKSAPSVPALLAKAQELMGQMDLDMARRFAIRIIEMEPGHVEAKQMLGIIEAEAGNVEEAKIVSAS